MTCKYKQISLLELSDIVKSSITFSEVMRKLGYTNNRGSSFKSLKNYLILNNIDFTHFKGKAHGTSDTAEYSLDDILVLNSSYSNTSRLKQRIIKQNLIEYKCSKCGITSWLNEPIVLQLHHINGNNRDNRIENLTFLCPNCHSQTHTFCGKKNKNINKQ